MTTFSIRYWIKPTGLAVGLMLCFASLAQPNLLLAEHSTANSVTTAEQKNGSNAIAVISGKVFLDCNRDRTQSDRELGVPGVRVFTQDGRFAVTDAQGQYSLYGLTARTHALKLDPASLPVDWEPIMLSNRQAGDATSRFVDLSFGQLHKANFADGTCHESTVSQVHERRAMALDEATQTLAPTQSSAVSLDPRPLARSFASPSFANPSIAKPSTFSAASPSVAANLVLNGLQVSMALRPLRESVEPLKPTNVVNTAASHPNLTSTSLAASQPTAQPLMGIGIVDGVIQLHKLKASQLAHRDQERSTFDQELRCLGRPTISIASQAGQWDCLHKDFAQGKGQTDLSTALYFKGTVKGEYLLTLAYDNAKDTTQRLYRDISPDEFYPIYGDASQRSFDASSSEKLYLRVDKGSSYVLYGDFSTSVAHTASQLTQTHRSLTGIRTRLGDTKAHIELFASKDNLKQTVLEFAANGTSGPFELGATGVVNSEKVQILVRSRLSFNAILSRKSLLRFVDYELEPNTGRLLLRAPLASLDAQLNPVSVHVVFEQEQTQAQITTLGQSKPLATFWTAGLQGFANPIPGVEVGAVAMKSFQPQAQRSLYGTYLSAQLGSNTQLALEAARSEQINGGADPSSSVSLSNKGQIAGNAVRGNAVRLELSQDLTQGLSAKLHAQKIDANFDNPAAGATKGQTDFGAQIHYRSSDSTALGVQFAQTKDQRSLLKTQDALFKTTYQLSSEFLGGPSDGIKLEAGVRYASQQMPAATNATNSITSNASLTSAASTSNTSNNAALLDHFTSLRFKAVLATSAQTSVYAELEQAINDSHRRLFAVGGDYRFADTASPDANKQRLPSANVSGTRIYARHELQNTLNTLNASNSLGGESTHAPLLKSFNTVVGVDAPVLALAQVFSEYRIKDAIDGKQAQAAIGLRQTWLPMLGAKVNASYERTQLIGAKTGAATESSTGSVESSAASGTSKAATVAVQYTPLLDWKANARLEWRDTQSQTNWLNTLGAAYKVNQNWSALVRSTLTLQNNHAHSADSAHAANTNDALSTPNGYLNKHRFQLGAAYRDIDHDQWNVITKLEQRTERDTMAGDNLKRSVSIASTHLHYQLRRDWWASGFAAIKRASERNDPLQISNRATGVMFASRLNWDLSDRWDAGLRIMANRSFGSRANSGGTNLGATNPVGTNTFGKQTKLGMGLELGYMIEENTWLSAGYNIWGIKDRDFASHDYIDAGWYLRLRYKFDETLFNQKADSSKAVQ